MNKKKFAIASIASFIFLFISDMLVHGYMLAGTYAMTPELWRPMAEMGMWSMLVVQVLSVLTLVYLFSQKMSPVKKCKGMENGIAVAMPMAVAAGTAFVYMPISIGLACAWAISTFVQVVLIAMITEKIYPNR